MDAVQRATCHHLSLVCMMLQGSPYYLHTYYPYLTQSLACMHASGKPMEAFASFHSMMEGELCSIPTLSSSSSSSFNYSTCGSDNCPPDGPLPGERHFSERLSIRAVRSRHRELCYGLVIYWESHALLGWTVRLIGCLF